MNKIACFMWSRVSPRGGAVSEVVQSQGSNSLVTVGAVVARSSCGYLLKPLSLLLAGMGLAHAAPVTPPAPNQLPTGGKIAAGVASIGQSFSQSGATMNISQGSQRATIDWQSFNLGSQAQVNFLQPSSSSATLNRVLDSNPSQIFGHINAPGQVFLVNPNGIYFAAGASVDVGGLVATTHSIANDDFMAGNLVFNRNGATGSIINEGELKAALGGYIALLAPEVRNRGVIVAQMGTVVLAAGEAYELQFDGNNTLANIRVQPATIKALVDNGNAVHAPGGVIILSAQAASRLQGGVVNNSGTLEATGLVDNGGVIRLSASDNISHTGSIMADAAPSSAGHGGTVSLISDLSNAASSTLVDGTISARGGDFGGDGGFVETSAASLKVSNAARIDTSAPSGKSGLWLLDPISINIGTDVTGAAIATALSTTNVTLDSTGTGSCTTVSCGTLSGSSGDITINNNITIASGATTDTTLTLNAYRNIVMNPGVAIDATSGGHKLNLVMNANNGNGTGFIQLGGASATTINTNGGNLWLGGGTLNISWNGLTVGNGYATGDNVSNNNGIYLGNVSVNTAGGNIAMYGKSASGNTIVLAPGENSSAADGLHFSWAYGNTINSGTGSIYMKGISQTAIANAWGAGIDFMYSGAVPAVSQSITSGATSGTAITMTGDASAASGSFTMGIWLDKASITTNGGGSISLTGLAGSGSNTSYSKGIIQGADFNSTISAGTGNISLTGDTQVYGFAGRNTTLSGTGTLSIQPYTPGTTIGLGTGVGTLSLPSAYFTANFANGFSSITVGSSTSGSIDFYGTPMTYQDPLRLYAGNANADVTFTGAIQDAGSGASSASLTVQASRNILLNNGTGITTHNQPVVLNSNLAGSGGYISTIYNTSITTNGGNLLMGGGTCTTTSCTGPAQGVVAGDWGIQLLGTTLATAGGNIWIWGQGANAGSQAAIFTYGSTLNSGAGALYMRGDGVYGGNRGNGIQLYEAGYTSGSTTWYVGTTVTAGAGGATIIANGNSTGDATAYSSSGLLLQGGSNIYTTGGGLLSVSASVNAGPSSGHPLTNNYINYLAGPTGSLGTLGGPSQSGNISIAFAGTESNTPFLPNINIPSGNLSITSDKGLSNAGQTNIYQSIAGTASVTAGGSSFDVLLANGGSGSSFTSGGAVSVSNAGNVSINNTGALSLGNITAGGNLTLQSTAAITQSGTVISNGTTTVAAGGSSSNVSLGSGTSFTSTGAVSVGNAGNVTLLSGDILTLGNIGAAGTVLAGSAPGKALTVATGSVISSASSATDAVVLMAAGPAGIFVNQAGSGAIHLTGGGSSRWLVYSTDPANNTAGGLNSGNFALWNRITSSGSPSEAGNRYAFSVTPALTFTSVNYTKTYGGILNYASPVITTDYTVTGKVNAATYGNVFSQDAYTGNPIMGSTGAPASAGVGSYPVTVNTSGITPPAGYGSSIGAAGTLTVTGAPLTITAGSVAKTYGQSPTLSAFSTSGALQNGETLTSVNLSSAGTTASAAVAGSPYAIVPSAAAGGNGFSAANYAISYVNGSLTISPAALTVTASNATKIYGQTPTLTAFTTSALQNGEAITSVTETSTGTAGTASVTGSPYAIVPSAASGSGFSASNYAITYINGSLSVTPAPLTVTASNATKI